MLKGGKLWKRRLTATPALVKIYTDLFVNRRAYALQSMRPILRVAAIITIVPKNGTQAPHGYCQSGLFPTTWREG